MNQPRFEIYPDAAGQYRWRLVAGNGEPVASGEAYTTLFGAERAVETVRIAARDARVLVLV